MKKSFLLSISLAIFLPLNPILAQSSTQWRGVDRSGYFPSEELLEKWPEKGPEQILHVEDLPDSYSSVVVQNGIIYTTGIRDKEEILSAIDSRGNILWNTVYGRAWEKSFPNARCTPTIEDHYAYLISGMGDLACVDLRGGKLRWKVDGYSRFEGRYGNWGVAESPLIVDNKMIYTPCGDITTMVAVDKENGETLWMSESLKDQSAYVSPALVNLGDLKSIVTVTGNYVIGVDADNGKMLWKLEYTSIDEPKSGGDINPVTPIAVGNEIFITSGYNHVGLMLSLAEDGRSVSVKWKSSDLDVHHGGVVVVDGYIYGANYTFVIKGNWVCLDWDSGELMYEQEWKSKGSIITTGDKLICYAERKGTIALVEPTPGSFKILSEFKITRGNGPHWSHPSIYDGVLYLRHGKSLLAYRIGK
jgi:outer membrane protein assembly factor BamB